MKSKSSGTVPKRGLQWYLLKPHWLSIHLPIAFKLALGMWMTIIPHISMAEPELPQPFSVTIEATRPDLPEPFSVTIEATRPDLPEPFSVTIEATRPDLPEPFPVNFEVVRPKSNKALTVKHKAFKKGVKKKSR